MPPTNAQKYVYSITRASGADVLIADNDERIINQFAGQVSDAVIVDLLDPEAIKTIGLNEMDLVVVSMGSSLEASIMCISVAKELGVPRIIAKAASDRMGKILKLVGADEIIYSEKESARQTARRILSPNILDYFILDDTLSVISMRPEAEWIGKSLNELRLRARYHMNVAAIRDKNGKTHANIDPTAPLTEDMELIVIAESSPVKKP